jgi:hypothetical protein
VIDHGVEIRFERTNPLRVRGLAIQHVEVIRRVTEIAARRDRLRSATQPRVRRDDRRHSSDDADRLVRDERQRPGGDAQRVHRLDIATAALAQHGERRLRDVAIRGERRTKRVELVGVRKLAVPQQPRGFLEGRPIGQLVDLMSCNHELAALAVDVTELR